MLSFLHCAPIDSQSDGHLSIDLELIVKYQCPTILESWHCCLTMGAGGSLKRLSLGDSRQFGVHCGRPHVPILVSVF